MDGCLGQVSRVDCKVMEMVAGGMKIAITASMVLLEHLWVG